MVVALDRWGRVLFMRGQGEDEAWELPGGPAARGQSPDAAALSGFEETTGHLIEELRLFGVFRDGGGSTGTQPFEVHVYYCDPDLDVELVGVDGAREFRYVSPGEIAAVSLSDPIRAIIEQFVRSTQYRAMFH